MGFDLSPSDCSAAATGAAATERMHGRFWTTMEAAAIRQHYPTRGAAAVQELYPDRTIAAIHAQARRLNVRRLNGTVAGMRFPRAFQPSEQVDNAIREGYMHASYRGAITDLAGRIGRPFWWIQKRATQLGITQGRKRVDLWTQAELNIVEENASCCLKVIAEKLKAEGFNRTQGAIAARICQDKLDRSDPDSWTTGDLAKLLGVTAKTVLDWIERRGMPSQKSKWSDGRVHHRITRRALRSWVKVHHHMIDLRRVDQPWFKELVFGST